MQPIQLISVKNIISRTVNGTFQEISFAVRVRNMGHGKQVEIHWCGEDDVWQVLPAAYRFEASEGGELWRAEVSFPLTMKSSIPGNIQFAARVEFNGETYWDSHFGLNYRSEADSGVIVFEPVETKVLEFHPILKPGRVALPIEVAVRQAIGPESVTIHWSVDGWVTQHHTPAYFRRNHWDLSAGSNARNPNRYGWGVWVGSIPLQHAYRLEYAVECRTASGVFWDNRGGRNYATKRSTLRVMTLNLHTYQEPDQQEKFKQIAKAITEKKIDLVCLQEVGEHWNNGEGDWASNAARIINSHLPEPCHLHTDWSHLGFDRFREGVAILSRYPFVYTDAGYVSDSQDPYDIHSRKVVMAQVRVPYFGLLNVFSAHLSWPSDGFFPQFDRLRAWAAQRHTPEVMATLLGGDFNITAGTEAYRHIVDTGEYEDQYLKIRDSSVFQQVFRKRQGDTMLLLAEDGRIDYLWLRNGNRLRAVYAEELFTPERYGRVSDHTAYWVEFEQR